MLISRSIYVLFTPSHPSLLLSGLSPPSLNRERSSNHQSAVSHCGQRRCHAGLSVLPDRTAVPSGYPYTSSLTPMIFTRCTENWKIHKSLKWPHSSQTLDFGDQCVFYQGFLEWKLLFLSMSNHCPLQPTLFRGSQQENVVLMLFGDQSSVKQRACPIMHFSNKPEVWAKLDFSALVVVPTIGS